MAVEEARANEASPVTERAPESVKEVRVPTEVREELTMLEPKVVASKTRALLMRKTEPVGRLIFPAVKVMPPAKEEVALSPLIVVVAVLPT